MSIGQYRFKFTGSTAKQQSVFADLETIGLRLSKLSLIELLELHKYDTAQYEYWIDKPESVDITSKHFDRIIDFEKEIEIRMGLIFNK